VPFSAGAHAGLLGSFVLLSLEDSAEDLLFAEGPGGDLVSRDDREKIARFVEYFEAVRGMALPGDQAEALIGRLISELDREAAESVQVSGPPAPRFASDLSPPGLAVRVG
jgi:hypothetical protein